MNVDSFEKKCVFVRVELNFRSNTAKFTNTKISSLFKYL